jgi:hypothetical protein
MLYARRTARGSPYQTSTGGSTSPEATVGFEQFEEGLGHGKRNLMSSLVSSLDCPPSESACTCAEERRFRA